MKIAWFGHVPHARGNGLVTYSREMVPGLRRRGHDLWFFYHAARARGSAREPQSTRLDALNVLDRVTFSRGNATETIRQILARERIEVAHLSLSFSQLDYRLPALCHAQNIPIVVTVHYPFGPANTFWGRAARVLYRLNAKTLAQYDAVIVFSETQRAILREYGVPAERVRVIPNGVDIATYAPGASDYKTQIGAAVLVVFVGRLDPEKNIGALINAFRELNLPDDHKLVVVGNGAELSKLKRKFGDDQRIIFKGYVGDAVERIRILRAGDIFVLPSAIEGLSLALLEAMATENALIATDVGADAEVLRNAGIVIDLNRLNRELPLALRTLIEHPDFRRDLAARARQRAVEQYSLDANIDRVVDLYRELTGKS